MGKTVCSIVLNDFVNDSRVLKEAVSLRSRGYDARVVALHSEGLHTIEEISGVPVERIALITRQWPKNKVVQFIKYLEFSVRVISKFRNFDILHCNDIGALPIGVAVKKFFNKQAKVVYDAHEYETEVSGLTGIRKHFVRWLERSTIKRADVVITVSESIAEEYSKNYSIVKPKIVLNCPNFSNIENCDLFRKRFNIRSEQKILLYQGGFSQSRGIEMLLNAFTELDDSFALVMMGYGTLTHLVEEYSRRYPNIHYLPAVPQSELLLYTASADYGLLFYENNCLNHYYCSPNKFFEYLMAGLPIICSDLFEMRRLIEKHKIGYVVGDHSSRNFSTILKEILQYRTNAIKENIAIAKTKYSWETQEQVLFEVYDGL